MSTIYEVMQYGTIIAADEDLGVIVTWNGSATLNLWADRGAGEWDGTDCRTIYGLADDMPVKGRTPPAVRAAEEWIAELNDGGEE